MKKRVPVVSDAIQGDRMRLVCFSQLLHMMQDLTSLAEVRKIWGSQDT